MKRPAAPWCLNPRGVRILQSDNISPAESAAWAVITPSYRGDFTRCQLLCESLNAFVSGEWHHYIIVERVDLELFRDLQGPKRSIIEMESLLPPWMHHLTTLSFINNRSIWFSFRTLFMIGWQIQQLIKLEMAFRVPETGLLYCDSDVFFMRPFDMSQLVVNGQYRFFHSDTDEPKETAANPTYMIAASKQLGLGKNPFPCRSYVDNMVTWHAPTVRALCAHIEKLSRRDWKAALGRHFIISEYSLYGLFVDRVLEDKSKLFSTNAAICKTIWHDKDLGPAGLGEYCDNLAPPVVAVGFQSFLGISIADLAIQLKRAIKQWSKNVAN